MLDSDVPTFPGPGEAPELWQSNPCKGESNLSTSSVSTHSHVPSAKVKHTSKKSIAVAGRVV